MEKSSILSKRYSNTGRNIWVEFNALTRQYATVNLGQGCPDFAPSEYIQRTLAEVVMEGNKYLQYTREQGHPRLVKAIAELHGPLLHRSIDPMTEVIVTHGADESLFLSFLSLVDPGDEVIILEPAYNSYRPMCLMAGGTPVSVPLRPRVSPPESSADWVMDPVELESKFNEKTKIFMLNNPGNPTGKCYTLEELEMIAALCIKYDVICVSDEVYEWLIYPGSKHHRIAAIPGMFERTVTISSAGKSFSVTGWRVGWSVGPKHLIDCLMTAHQNGDTNCSTPAGEAIARCIETEIKRLDQPDCHFTVQRNKLLSQRNKMVEILREAGFTPCVPEAGYLLLADWSKIATKQQIEDDSDDLPDFKFAKWMLKKYEIATIPPTAFCEDNKDVVASHVRMCFYKTDEMLEKAREYFNKLPKI